MNGKIIIFTDGSSRGNPGPGGWGAIVVRSGEVTELGGAEAQTTNNRMELSAAIEALRFVADSAGKEQIVINTDSRYLINGATKWLDGWRKKNWITSQKEPVLNRDLWEALSELLEQFSDSGALSAQIKWNYVGGHSGIAGNERCDEIATGFADGDKVSLYKGALEKYSVDVASVAENESGKSSESVKSPEGTDHISKKARSRAKAYSYMSMVDGVITRHSTWPECEARVKGVAGARYKKALTAAEEAHIIAEWKAL